MNYKEQNQIIIISYIVSISASFIMTKFITNFSGLEIVISHVNVPTILISGLEVVIRHLNVPTILTLWWLFYFKYGWRLPGINKLIIFRVDLNGTWFGSYQSLDSQNQEAKGEIGIRIKQDFLTISLKSFTEKFNNYSYSEEVKYDEKSDTYGVVYVYSQKENNILDTSHRNGTSELTFKKSDDALYLEGTFWTAHGTKGELSVRRITKKQIDTFKETKIISESK
ncbi:hypothetical protein [Tychonema sp. LEGE 07203]|uniref:Cap15 family cyclic dinucleotide receptor domain-containing protein n=1 Tax=Tychonema sp. LEGE 07203 TaxID=1828671 RepID=UPI00187FC923|nr:hypothetical protein [Tychonema sp. LEGE 07203]MBE9092445.1 hypothetical protein [Tychonema sp. LEGE 07203]